MGKYNFNSFIDRSHSDAIKYCELSKWFDADDLLPLWIADMDFSVCPEITEALQQRLSHRIYGYASVPDDFFPTITDWLSRRHNFATSPEELSFIPGIVRGIGYVINHFCKAGDKIVIQPPVYHPFKRLVEGNNCIPLNNPLIRTENSYEMDLDGLEEIVRREHPRMMILCNPHNPIGIQWSHETLARVADICAAEGVIVVSDEIHGDLMLQDRPHIPYLSVNENARRTKHSTSRGSYALGALSKTKQCVKASMAGWSSTNSIHPPALPLSALSPHTIMARIGLTRLSNIYKTILISLATRLTEYRTDE